MINLRKKIRQMEGMIGMVLLTGFFCTACGNESAAEAKQAPDSTTPVASEASDFSDIKTDEPDNSHLEDFSMPVKEKLDGAKFENVALAAEQIGYDFQAVEKFSNGYEFVWLTVADDVLVLTYKSGDKKVNITVGSPGETFEAGEPDEIRDEFTWINEIDVRIHHYIHFEMPLNWEELITEEEQQLLDSGLAGGGVDNSHTEIIRHDLWNFIWQQEGVEFCVENELNFVAEGNAEETTKEELRGMVEEWMEVNQRKETEHEDKEAEQ